MQYACEHFACRGLLQCLRVIFRIASLEGQGFSLVLRRSAILAGITICQSEAQRRQTKQTYISFPGS